MQCSFGIPRVALTIGRLALILLLGLLLPLAIHSQTAAASNPLANDLFLGDTPFRAITYEFPTTIWPNTLPPLCSLARDLPLIAESGATALYTRGRQPADSDHIFLSLLATTRLSWIASFALPEDMNPNGSLLDQQAELLARFSEFAERYAGSRSLRGVVLDFDKAQVAESALLANEFAAILERHFPENTPRLGHVAYSPTRLDTSPAGISFWLYRFEGTLPTNANRLQLRQRTPLSIVFDLSEVSQWLLLPEDAAPGSLQASWKDYLSLFLGGASTQPLLTLRFLGQRESSSSSTTVSSNGPTTTTLSFRFRPDALFTGVRDQHLTENLQPTLFGIQQREAWQAPSFESHAAAPVVENIWNAASKAPEISPGTQVLVEGRLFRKGEADTISGHWPLHAGARCVCVGERPIPLGTLSDSSVVAHLPWLLAPGTTQLRLVREGIASAPIPLELLELSPAIYPDDVKRSDGDAPNGCDVSEANGVKPGETLELRVTGAGSLNGDLKDLQVLLDGVTTELLQAGLDSNEPGIARVAVRVPERSAANAGQGLYLRRKGKSSNVLPISYAGNARPTVGLVASTSQIQLQSGGSSAPLTIKTQGLNGYCGPVEFEVLGLPAGVSALISSVDAGREATLRLSADSIAAPTDNLKIFLYAIPSPGDLQLLALDLTILPRLATVEIVAESAGYAAGSIAALYWNNTLLAPTGKPEFRGLYLLVVNHLTGVFASPEHYDIYASAQESQRLESRLTALPNGFLVAMAIADDATLEMQPSLRALIQSRLGSQAITTLAYQNSWAIIGKLGEAAPLAELASAEDPVRALAVVSLPPG